MPHWAHDWFRSVGHSFKGSVDVVDEVVPLIKSSSDRVLDSLGLEPWFSVRVIDVTMGTHEGVERSDLVEGNKKLIGDITVESRNVSSTKSVT